MSHNFICLQLLLLLLLLLLNANAEQQHSWVVQIDSGHETAKSVADEHRLVNHGPLPYLNNKFEFRLSAEELKRSQEQAAENDEPLHHRIHKSLTSHPKISWVAYQHSLKRTKRDYRPSKPRSLADFTPWQMNHASSGLFKDPLWPQQWYLHDTRTSVSQPKVDLHLLPVWRRNLTGRGVLVAVVDDGLEKDHPDIVENYDADASYDYNNDRRDPTPDYAHIDDSRHGTQCAGEIAMSANNSVCGVGVAFNARIGGVKILGGRTTDAVEARGLTHALHRVDVYSCSWGPSDDGQTMAGPGPLAAEALEAAVKRGRNGKGAIVVWAAGNGAPFKDNCNCDGYATSVFTLTVSSVSQHLKRPWYAERCSATMATTFSSGVQNSGGHDDQLISTIDLRHKCTNQFSGTSASAPLAAGIVALALQANPNLTWRDVQHAVVWTSEVAPLINNNGWRDNGAGHSYHPDFGFGLFNAAALVELVMPDKWRRVPEKLVEDFGNWQCDNEWRISRSNPGINCDVTVGREAKVRYLEHVQLRVRMRHPKRGSLSVTLVSPAGSATSLLTPRPDDASADGLNWTFMTVHLWGEQPQGVWQLRIRDEISAVNKTSGDLQQLRLVIHGTEEMPAHRRAAGGRRRYDPLYNQKQNVVRTRGGRGFGSGFGRGFGSGFGSGGGRLDQDDD